MTNITSSIGKVALFFSKERAKMESKKGTIKEAKTIFEKLKTNVNSVLFTEEKINNNFFKRLKRSSYAEDKKLASLILTLENFDENRIKFF